MRNLCDISIRGNFKSVLQATIYLSDVYKIKAVLSRLLVGDRVLVREVLTSNLTRRVLVKELWSFWKEKLYPSR